MVVAALRRARRGLVALELSSCMKIELAGSKTVPRLGLGDIVRWVLSADLGLDPPLGERERYLACLMLSTVADRSFAICYLLLYVDCLFIS